MFNGKIYRDAIISGANNILNNRVKVDELNVFPVPDGDTGTNMSMTASATSLELSRLSDDATVAEVTKAAASAMLRGARGNSGVILSLLFRGLSKGMKEIETADGAQFASALKLGVEAAYGAVMKPTEGTILTVARVAQEKAQIAADAGQDALAVAEAALKGACDILEETPEMLPALKKAGVVDAGGKGFCVILEGMLQVFRGGEIIAVQDASADKGEAVVESAVALAEEDITFTYCTEFIVRRASDNAEDAVNLRAYLESIGDCVVVVDDEEIIKVHVHTDHPGNAFEKGLEFGQLINMKVENMRDQNERAKHNSKLPQEKKNPISGKSYTPVAPEKPYGFVVVSAGAGLENLFKDLGADVVVSGGQTMNPSTDDILRAIESTPAETVFVLPNNKNIIMAAEQAIPLATRKVEVLHTRTIPMGVSSMLAFDPEADTEANVIAMRAAYEAVGSGQITFAARDSEYDGHKIKMGDLLAIKNGKIDFVETDMNKCITKLVKALLTKESYAITVFYGEDITEEQAMEAQAAIQAKVGSDIEVVMVDGGQPVYYYIISVE
ncbi:MAG: DAK2 domain-containing protein [Clostridia bacterium]|nr:DAK2 domain-containing protein [Clostridia bacterium]